MFAELLLQLLEQIAPKLRMGDGPPPEEDTQLHLIAGIKKLRRLAPLGLKVVSADLRLDTYFLQARHMLRLARITLFPALFVSEFAVIHQPADGGNRVWRNLYQVQPTLARHLQRIARVNHADLLPLIINKSYLADANSFVHTSLNWSRNSLPPELLALHVGHTKKPVQKDRRFASDNADQIYHPRAADSIISTIGSRSLTHAGGQPQHRPRVHFIPSQLCHQCIHAGEIGIRPQMRHEQCRESLAI